jgi:hypothetical protein
MGGTVTGAGSTARNIFNARGGTSTAGNDPLMHYAGMTTPGNVGTYGFRGVEKLSYQPTIGIARPCKYSTDEWGVDMTGTVLDVGYHAFSCSKCHNPHASRLQRLMITNCLDTKHNEWDNTYTANAATSTMNNGRKLSQWTSAQNCHRKVGTGGTTEGRLGASGSGWNTVTPW